MAAAQPRDAGGAKALLIIEIVLPAIAMDTSWLKLTFVPDLSPIHNSCEVAISSSGLLTQCVFDCSRAAEQQTLKSESTQLNEEQLGRIVECVERLDFERIRTRIERSGTILGTAELTIAVSGADGSVQEISGPILHFHRGYHDYQQVIKPAQDLWQVLKTLAPIDLLEMRKKME